MAQSGCFSCLKFLVFVTNFLVWLFGLGVVAVSLWLLFDEHIYSQTLDNQRNDYFTGTYLVLGIGACMTIIGFLGCCGAWRESSWMLGSFFAFLVAIFIAEICAGVFIYFQKETLESLIEKSVEETVLQKYMYNSSSASVHTFDKVQEEMGCCGSKGPKDWARSVFNNPESRDREIGVIVSNQQYNIPRSCCRYPESKPCLTATQIQILDTPDSDVLYTQGCADMMVEFVENNIMFLFAAGIGILLLEVFSMVLSMCLCCTIKKIRDMKA